MSEKKYRACLIGVLALVLIAGAFFYYKNSREIETPEDGILVERTVEGEDAGMEFAA